MWPQLHGYPPALQRLATIRLSGYRFYSFSVLLRQLAALHYLEAVELDNITWTVPCNSADVPRRKWTFRELTGIFASTCTEYWPFLWIALASCFWEDADEAFPLERAEASMLCGGQLIQALLQAYGARALSVLKLSDGMYRSAPEWVHF
ncbi:hypothetical protein PsYK624_170400 [Phanerochaete sordida]|uniref:Uncharacterized protein n=1 Tax=Phanerochaete sordida TaxID=48140 RepID=A0A9P3GUF8_9APHY|nr:hypothetical protein PsYK624_170400 [Phanerochaete sordida]